MCCCGFFPVSHSFISSTGIQKQAHRILCKYVKILREEVNMQVCFCFFLNSVCFRKVFYSSSALQHLVLQGEVLLDVPAV